MEIPGRGSLFRYGVADDRSRSGKSSNCWRLTRFLPGSMDPAWDRRSLISDRLRIVGRIYRLHMALESREHIEGFHLCLCQSDRGRVSGMACATRKSGWIHSGRKRDCDRLGRTGDQCESKITDHRFDTACPGSCKRLRTSIRAYCACWHGFQTYERSFERGSTPDDSLTDVTP